MTLSFFKKLSVILCQIKNYFSYLLQHTIFFPIFNRYLTPTYATEFLQVKRVEFC